LVLYVALARSAVVVLSLAMARSCFVVLSGSLARSAVVVLSPALATRHNPNTALYGQALNAPVGAVLQNKLNSASPSSVIP
jgi:hypothetical protein